MFGVKFTLTGDKDVDRAFAELPKRAQRKVLREALRPAAKVLLTQARANITKRTGKAAASLKVKAGKRTRTGSVTLQVVTSSGWFKGDQYYLPMGELGFKLGSRRLYPTSAGPRHKLGKRWIRQRIPVDGKRWIRSALEQREAEARSLGLRLLREGIEREAKNLARSSV